MIPFLEALAALPKLGALVEQLCAAIAAWWLSRQQEETYQQIINAAAMSARAQNQNDRIKALQAWQSALSRPRIK
jgi:hypothetical protein